MVCVIIVGNAAGINIDIVLTVAFHMRLAVITLLSHSTGTWYHRRTGVDSLIT